MDSISKITICICEGPHDTAFLYRILKTKCYETFKGTLDDLPNIIGDFIAQNNKKIEYNKLKIDSLKNEFVPNKIMYQEDEMILLYAMGGDTKIANLQKLIEYYLNNIQSQTIDTNQHGKSFSSGESVNEYKFLFFYDADKNKQQQIDKVKKIFNIENLEHNKVIKKEDFYLGGYIFSDDEDKGALEDILFDIMKQDNENIFDEAEKYLNLIEEDRLKRLKIECKENSITEKRDKKHKIYQKKSIFGIVGQLQNSGASNVVAIEHSDYLNLEKINNSEKLQEIANFIIKQEN